MFTVTNPVRKVAAAPERRRAAAVRDGTPATPPDVDPPKGSTAEAVAKWLAVVRDNSYPACEAADRELARRGAELVPFLTSVLQDPAVGCHALEVLAMIGPAAQGALPALERHLAGGGNDWAVLQTMACLGPAAVPYLTRVLKDGAQNLRWAASEAIREHCRADPDVVAALIAATKDADYITRSSAVETLGQFHVLPETSVAALTRALKDDDVSVRRMAANALSRFGSAAAAARGSLKTAQGDPHEEVADAAAKALRAIGAAAPDEDRARR
jgi:hypothetical protein